MYDRNPTETLKSKNQVQILIEQNKSGELRNYLARLVDSDMTLLK